MKYPEPESSLLEFKEKLPARDQVLKTVIAFCNAFGGKVMIGVRDSGEVVGIEEKEVESLLEYLDKSIYESCTPPIIPEIHTQRLGEKLVLVIQVSPGMQKPYFIRTEGIAHGTFIRLGRSTVRADAGTIEELHRQARRIAYDCTPVYHGRTEDLDPERFKVFLEGKETRRTRSFSAREMGTLLEAYHLVVAEQSRRFPTVGGLLLFNPAPGRWFPEAFIICTEFAGRSGRQASRTRDFTGDLFSQFHGAFDFIEGSLGKSFAIRGKQRTEVHEVPLVAVREALLNAIVHRNYSIPGPIKVALFEDRLEIFSPGGFPGPFNVNNLASGVTYIRNTAITKVFREAGYIEKLGTGFITMLESYRTMGLRLPSVIEGENYIKCILPRVKQENGGDPDDEAVLNLFYRLDSISILDAMEATGSSRATSGRRLKRLEDSGAIHRRGKGPNTRYYQGKAKG